MVSKEEFKKEVKQISQEINAIPRQVRIREMKSKMGSCSPNKIITFNKSLLKVGPSLRREAITHELLHIRYKNHGKMFREVLKAYVERTH
jgi:predicted metal-dependent hydrolase